MKKMAFLSIFALFAASALFAQSLPSAFRAFSLGMNLKALEDALAKDSLFKYPGEAPGVEVHLTPQERAAETTGLVELPPDAGENTRLVQATGSGSFIDNAAFQFNEGKLYLMSFSMNTELIDYNSIFARLKSKYGLPKSLSPDEAVWESESVRMNISAPCTVRYIDVAAFKAIGQSETAKTAAKTTALEDFLNGF
ncbi:MAG: hypothetical protein LBM77_01565 [Spirochaetaceae bacterium]|jgi:hypothetical protein|nr:hypothetical protein [Spirochaetaceae bacterium]